MKTVSKLKLNKETIASLNDAEKNGIKGGFAAGCGTYLDPISCNTMSKDGHVSDCENCATGKAKCPQKPQTQQ